MRSASFLVFAVGLGTTAFLAANTAHAADTLDACGDFWENPSTAECTVEVDVPTCETKCEELNVTVECSAELYVDCQGQCNVTVDVGCTTDCQASCELNCTEGSFDCYAYCNGDCQANCDAFCADSGDQTQCLASCEASCTGDCQAGCEASPPDCTGGCEASCQGECHAEANADCQVTCQSDGYVQCEADVTGGCKTQCSEPDGALFCNGEWINTTDLDACIQAIEDQYNITVETHSSASCTGNECTAEAGCTATCAVSPEHQGSTSVGLAAFGLVGIGLFAARRRSRKARGL
ncbi:MAG: hypothetical protein U0271_18435 [Polyangiaceae bacterium]